MRDLHLVVPGITNVVDAVSDSICFPFIELKLALAASRTSFNVLLNLVCNVDSGAEDVLQLWREGLVA